MNSVISYQVSEYKEKILEHLRLFDSIPLGGVVK